MGVEQSRPGVGVVILNYNGCDDTIACLRSIQAARYTPLHVIVVDNGSRDDSVARIREPFPGIALMETGANLGFAGGNNIGIRAALDGGADYVLLLNNDTEIAPDMLDRLVAECEHDPGIGVAGPKIMYWDRPDMIWSAGGAIDWRRGRSEMLGLDCADDGRFDEQRDVDFVTGCALLVRRAAIEQAGRLDERFGMYYEETEWCVRIARAGWRIKFVPSARMWHKISPAAQAESPRIIYYMARNRLLFLKLIRAPLSAWLHALVLQDLRTWTAWRLRPRWRHRAAHRAALRRAWADFARRRFGMAA